MFSTIKSVIFDIGGVLVDLYPERCVEAFKSIGYPQAEEMIGRYCPSKILQRVESGEMTGEELVEYIHKDSGNESITYEDVRDAYIAFLGTIPIKKLRAIKSLRDAGIKTYALSNINEFVMPHLRSELFTADGLSTEEYFHYTYLSYEMGALKPDRRIFQMMIDHSGMKPEESLFIDDSPANIESAREMGFQVYLAAPEEDFTPLLKEIEECCAKS